MAVQKTFLPNEPSPRQLVYRMSAKGDCIEGALTIDLLTWQDGEDTDLILTSGIGPVKKEVYRAKGSAKMEFDPPLQVINLEIAEMKSGVLFVYTLG